MGIENAVDRAVRSRFGRFGIPSAALRFSSERTDD
jgi:hypothetical protein